MDEGWSSRSDLTKVSPEINLQEIIDYGRQKHVSVILWASWSAVTQQMDTVFPLCSKMGMKGFEIDFIDRDDQKAVASTYEIARKAAEYQLTRLWRWIDRSASTLRLHAERAQHGMWEP